MAVDVGDCSTFRSAKVVADVGVVAVIWFV